MTSTYSEAGGRFPDILTVKTVLTAIVAGLIMILLSLFFAPGLIGLREYITHEPADIEIAVRSGFLVFALQLLCILLLFLFVRPVQEVRLRLILYFLTAEMLLLCAIWLADPPDRFFRSEQSMLTFFSSIVLTGCALTAGINLLLLRILKRRDRADRLFWGLFATAFLYAAADEYFMLHERMAARIGAENWVQDLFTVAYVVGAVVVIGLFYREFRNGLFRMKHVFFRLLLVGIVVLGAAFFLDTFKGLFLWLDPYIDSSHLRNSAEEMLEFTAAVLFCAAFCINGLEMDENRLLNLFRERLPVPQARRSIQFGFIGAVLAIALILITLKLQFGRADGRIVQESNVQLTEVAGYRDGLRGADGLLFHPELGLVVCNEDTGELLVFNAADRKRILIASGRGLESPEGLAADGGQLYVSDDSARRILKYDLSDDQLTELPLNVRSPEGLAVDAAGRLHVADEELSIVFQTSDAGPITRAGAIHGLKTPEEMAFDDKGNLYVTDEEAMSIFLITPDGTVSLFAGASAGLVRPEGITVHDGALYVTDEGAGTVSRFSLDGKRDILLTFTRRYRRVLGIAFDGQDRLHVICRDPFSENAHLFRCRLDR